MCVAKTFNCTCIGMQLVMLSGISIDKLTFEGDRMVLTIQTS